MKTILTVICCLFISVGPSFSSTLENENEARKLTDSIMQEIGQGNFKIGFNKMKSYVVIPESEFDSASLKSQSQREQFGFRYGETIGYEYIGTKKLGESLLLIQYIEKTIKHALPWAFYFYKTDSGWILNSFNWNDDFKPLFHVHYK